MTRSVSPAGKEFQLEGTSGNVRVVHRTEAEASAEVDPEDSGGAASSGDGLGQEMAAEVEEDEGRQEEGEDGRDPRKISAPSKVRREEGRPTN